jgi:hypothetical protein
MVLPWVKKQSLAATKASRNGTGTSKPTKDTVPFDSTIALPHQQAL